MNESKATILCLNTEGPKHDTKRIIPYLRGNPVVDVMLAQEIYKPDFLRYLKLFGYGAYGACSWRERDSASKNPQKLEEWGLAILSTHPIIDARILPYSIAGRGRVPNFDETTFPETDLLEGERRLILCATTIIKGKEWNFLTTKFTWTPDGNPTPTQYDDLQTMTQQLEKLSLKGFVFGADFNAPRGGPIHNELAKRFKSNIPPEIESTLDPSLHRSKRKLVVDDILTTPEYLVTGLAVREGLSDHVGLEASIVNQI